MKKRRKSYPAVQFGTSLMLVVFMILCLTAFATLSLSSAMRDYEYSKKAADKTSDYYKADAAAGCRLAEIDTILKETAQANQASGASGQDPDSYMGKVLDRLQDEAMFDTLTEEDSSNPQITYNVPVNERQSLRVTLALNTPDTSGDRLYRIVQWKEISSQEWNNSTTLPVIGSD